MKRNIQEIDDDIIRKKRIIEQALYNDTDIIELLDDPAVDPSMPDEILYSSIYPFIRIPDAQDTSKNFITFSVSDAGRTSNNELMKIQYVQFVIFVHKDLVKTKYGMARHDCLGYIVRDIFNLSDMLGSQLNLVYNQEGTTDTNFCTRTLKFELIDDNSAKPNRTNPYEFNKIVGHRR